MHIPANDRVTPPTLEYYVEARDGFSGDPASELAALLIDHVRESRQLNRDQTRLEEEHLRFVQAAQVKQLRSEADELREAGRAKAFGMIVGGSLTVASGVALGGAGRETHWSKGFDGGAKGAHGGGELIASEHELHAGRARARSTEYEHQAGESKRRLDDLSDARSYSRNLERTAFDHLEKVQEAQAATDKAQTSWRG